MPKLKTHKGAKKRIKLTATGKLKRSCAFKNHILSKKSRERKRKLRHGDFVSKKEAKRVKRLLPYL
ncbi:MAG: 50S ribosomal protein L35 [Thermoanaerobaculia bacterium]